MQGTTLGLESHPRRIQRRSLPWWSWCSCWRLILWGLRPEGLHLHHPVWAAHHSSPLGLLRTRPWTLPPLLHSLSLGVWAYYSSVNLFPQKLSTIVYLSHSFHKLLMAFTVSHHLASPFRPHSLMFLTIPHPKPKGQHTFSLLVFQSPHSLPPTIPANTCSLFTSYDGHTSLPTMPCLPNSFLSTSSQGGPSWSCRPRPSPCYKSPSIISCLAFTWLWLAQHPFLPFAQGAGPKSFLVVDISLELSTVNIWWMNEIRKEWMSR